jgi:hypothetical protein
MACTPGSSSFSCSRRLCASPLRGVLLAFGLMMVPTQVYFLFAAPEEPATGALMVIALTTGGIAGVVALANLLSWILRPKNRAGSRQ